MQLADRYPFVVLYVPRFPHKVGRAYFRTLNTSDLHELDLELVANAIGSEILRDLNLSFMNKLVYLTCSL